ncbi:unnamed protein product [Caenorhabditis auriculariae]|uniref:chitin synthase n=1 Tax=Caenorhabditis auriculariae TaxID=2777116 RepID=A0A8S1HWH7_9PELO|nr:unnamed protein product [Caenorhabditis auriculariae]
MTNVGDWNAFRSEKRGHSDGPTLSPWMITALQAAKLTIFCTCNFLLTIGASFSKICVLLLSTNILPKQLPDSFSKTCFRAAVRRSTTSMAAMYSALTLVQCFPDFVRVAQSSSQLWLGVNSPVLRLFVLVECIRALGLATLSFFVFPQLDLARCALLSACLPLVASFQSCMADFSNSSRSGTSLRNRLGKCLLMAPHLLLCLIFFSSSYLWAVLDRSFDAVISLPVGLFLASVGFWESWINVRHAKTYFDDLYKVKYGVKKVNSSTKFTTSLLRIIITFTTMIFAVNINSHAKLSVGNFFQAIFQWSFQTNYTKILILACFLVFLHLLLRGITRFLAALDLHPISFTHPMSISPLIVFSVVRFVCHSPKCIVARILAKFGLRWSCDPWASEEALVAEYAVCIVWLAIGCYRGWKVVRQRYFETTEEIISSMSPTCNGLCVEHSLVIFQHSLSKIVSSPLEDEEDVGDLRDQFRIRNDDVNRSMTVYMCATMWHETEIEMRQVLRSILKLDIDHSSRNTRRQGNELQYQLEGHIFFDDAWEDKEEPTGTVRQPNEFFQMFFQLLNEMTKEKVNEFGTMESRILVNTPYGGRLVIKLPAGTLLYVHLKDKKLIRHKKRWSQVMYMYYLLGHRIMDSPLSIEDRQRMADNTFILAIDGDSKFEPDALLRLLHLMKTKNDIGCACGRIHPIGSGVMVWYQKFEYAIAHWFQKAAEHVFGCVLCAPGCFSLFRASALMDDNIMHKYTKTAEEPRHYVQYDQGEDRWLSTLLLKQGYRIEYVAASDAETYAPEGFEEFFNQRRRWTPSSIANTVDLLMDYKRAIANNKSISLAYIAYQFMVIFFSMLGPAIIFTMLVFAQVAAFGANSTDMMIYNGIPIVFYVLLCFTTESNVQLFYAKMMSIAYAFVMLAVLVATSSQIVLETVVAPTSLFIVTMVMIFFSAACLHPKEFSNILYGTVFFLMIPSTYVFLSLYSLINLNVINWGTREAVAKATGTTAKKAPMERWLNNSLTALKKVFSYFTRRGEKSAERESILEKKISEVESVLEKMKRGETAETAKVSREDDEESTQKLMQQETDSSVELKLPSEEVKQKQDKYAWMSTDSLKVCEKGKLKDAEKQFWAQLIDNYLKPIVSSPAEQKQVADGLVSLRNQIAFTILLINALLALAIILIQKHKNVLSIKWVPYEGFQWTKMNEMTGQFETTAEPLKIDPLGMGIVIFLLAILFVQTIGMVLHRINTMLGAFHEVKNLYDYGVNSQKSTKAEDERILSKARQMMYATDYKSGHAADGYNRSRGDESSGENVLYKLQKARLAERMQKSALSDCLAEE